MTGRITKLVSNENYLELLNQIADSIHYLVFSVDDNPEPRKIGIKTVDEEPIRSYAVP